MVGNEGRIVKAEVDDMAQEGAQYSRIGTGLYRQVILGLTGQLGRPWVDDYDSLLSSDGFDHRQGQDRVGFGQIGPYHKDHIGGIKVSSRIGGGCTPEASTQHLLGGRLLAMI